MSLAHEVDILARTIYAEARGEPFEGQVAVAWVIKNRSLDRRARWPRTVAEVCQQPKQFSCWNGGDKNYERMLAVTMEDQAFVRAVGIACLVLAGDIRDHARGANHYMRTDWMDRVSWDDRMVKTAEIGFHTFLKG